jgi:uncharacterized protein (TIGR03437 family)
MRLEADGILSGTPSEPGNFELTVRVSDAAGAVAAKAFVLNVRSAPISFSREGVVNAASFLPGPVSPFEIVTVYGLGFGPPEPAAAIWEGPGTLATTVAGTRVYFDGVPAPIVHVMSGQVSVAVPDLPEAVSTTDVVLEYRGVRSARAEVSVAAVSPGIFTANGGGSGQVAALNTDGTYNSSANPVERGGVLVLYGTGFGRLRASDPPVSVTIGGIMTDVVYAGPIAGHIRGLTQINVAVPLSVEPGDRVPISVAAGERQSQSGLTIAVR